MRTLALLAILTAANGAFAQQQVTNITNATVDSISIVNTVSGVDISLKGINRDPESRLVIHRESEDRIVNMTKGRHEENGKDFIDRHLLNRFDTVGIVDPWQFIIGGLGFGFNTAVAAPEGMDIDMGRSLDFSALYLAGAQYRLPGTENTINFGLGLDWRNFRMERSAGCFHPHAGSLGLGNYPEGVQPHLSQLRLFNLTVPVLYRQMLPWRPTPFGKMSLCLGPVINFNCRSSVKSQWTRTDGVKVEEYSRDLPKSPVTIDALAVLYLNSSIGVYARYSPMHQLGENALSFSAFTTGLCIGF